MSKRLNIEIETSDRFLGYEMLESQSLTAGKSHITLSDGSTVEYSGSLVRKSSGLPQVLELMIALGSGVGTSVVGTWLYEKLKGKPAKLHINRREVEITADRIRIVIEEIEKEG